MYWIYEAKIKGFIKPIPMKSMLYHDYTIQLQVQKYKGFLKLKMLNIIVKKKHFQQGLCGRKKIEMSLQKLM